MRGPLLQRPSPASDPARPGACADTVGTSECVMRLGMGRVYGLLPVITELGPEPLTRIVTRQVCCSRSSVGWGWWCALAVRRCTGPVASSPLRAGIRVSPHEYVLVARRVRAAARARLPREPHPVWASRTSRS
jgi:hypothetical protein